MEIEAKFAVPNVETFQQLQTVDQLAGFKLSPGMVKQIHDTFLDTADRLILASGHACRRRQTNGEVLITLKQLTAVEGAVHRREELEVGLPADAPPAEWPASPARDRVLQLAGGAPLTPLFSQQQRRIVRSVKRGRRLVAELSLDQVHLAADGKEQTYFELEVELASKGTEDDLVAIVTYLQDEWALNPEPRSKFERALAFFEGTPAQPRRRAGAARSRATSKSRPETSLAEEIDTDSQSERVKTVVRRDSRRSVEGMAQPVDGKVAPQPKQPPETPGLNPDDTMATAARKTLHLHFQRMLYHEPGTRLGEDIEELHDMRVAIRRMRAAVRVFGDYLDSEQMKPLVKGLRRTGRALGAVRDLDVFEDKLQAYVKTLPKQEQAGLDPLLAAWAAEREKAHAEMLAYLDSKRYSRFKKRLGKFLRTPGAGAQPVFSRDDQPLPHRLRHVVPVVVYQRLADVRAYDEWVTGPEVPLERLHQLRIAFKRLRYTLEFFEEVLGPEAKRLIEDIKAMQDHLGALQDAGVASALLRDFLTHGTWSHTNARKKKKTSPPEPSEAAGVEAYLETKQAEIQHLLDTFPEAWARFQSPAVSELVAAAVAHL